MDSAIAAKSEWVITFPTKKLHVNVLTALPPFSEEWDGRTACEEFSIIVYDREEQETRPEDGVVSPKPPTGSNPTLCQEANVVEFQLPGQTPGTASQVLGATNLTTVASVGEAHATENGWAKISFNEPTQQLRSPELYPNTNLADTFYGLPVAGFMVQQYTNAAAAPGIPAYLDVNHIDNK